MRVLTWNLYFGAGLEPVFRLRDVAEIPAVVGALWRAVLASEPAARLARVAGVLAATRPDLVALQEVARYEVFTPGEARPPALDFLELLLAALARRGEGYRVVAAGENFGATLPSDEGRVVGFVDRDVVLAREGVATSEPRAVRFVAAAAFGPPGAGFTVPRGFLTVRAEREGEVVRLVDAHLEGGWFGPVQGAQATELLAAVAGEPLPTILAGDLNSGPGSEVYARCLAAGFEDAWATRGGDPGPTCCRAADLRAGGLTARIDLLLHRGLAAAEVARVGVESSDQTAGGHWPSDHAGVVAAFARRTR